MKRRLGIAQALIHDPKVIVVDEPTTGLDPEERIRFRNLLSKAAGNNVSIILSTHIVGDISSSCNNMTLLNKGQISFVGSPEELIKRAEGKVWRAVVPDDIFQRINEEYPVITTIPVANGWEIQIVSETQPCEGAELFAPNLEHAYVYYIDSKFDLWRKG